MKDFLRRYFTVKGIMAGNRNQLNATAVEYGLIAAAVAFGIVAVVQGLGNKPKPTSSSPLAISQSK